MGNRSHRLNQASVKSAVGMGVVELLVVAAVAGIVMTVVATFFAFQSRVARDTQARNELDVRARAVAEAIVQDLRLAGARAVVDENRRAEFVAFPDVDCATFADCIRVDGDENPVGGFVVWYASSLFLEGALDPSANVAPPETCRHVEYRLDGTTLYRADTPCSAPPATDEVTQFEYEFATGISSLRLSFSCSDGSDDVVRPSECFEGGGHQRFVREARVEIVALSDRRLELDETVSLAVTLVNMRSPTRFGE